MPKGFVRQQKHAVQSRHDVRRLRSRSEGMVKERVSMPGDMLIFLPVPFSDRNANDAFSRILILSL